MTGIAGSELLLLMLIGLVILGPQRLPKIASQIGGWIGQARRMTRAMKRQLEDELRIEETPSINTPVVPPAVVSEPAEPPEVTEEPEAHVPNDDDTYSPLHGEEEKEEKSA